MKRAACSQQRLISFAMSIGLCMGMSVAAWGQVNMWKIGGSGRVWREWGTFFSMEQTPAGAIQPMQFHPDQNVCTTVGKWYLLYPVFEAGQWRVRRAASDWRDGWPGTATQLAVIVDGDSTTAAVWKDPLGKPKGVSLTFDLGAGIPINRLRFYPRLEGEDELGPFVEFYSRGWELLASTGSSDLKVVKANPEETSPVVDVSFPRRFVRYFRWKNTAEDHFELAEIELYGDGFVNEARFESDVIDLGAPMNFGRLVWSQSVWKNEGGVLHPVSGEVPVSAKVWTRSGTDPTPYRYYRIGDTGEEEEVKDKKAYDRLPDRTYVSVPGQDVPTLLPPVPGQKGSIRLDREHWSFWSIPHEVSGQAIRSPDARRYFQFKVVLKTDDPDVMVRVDSLYFEYSEPLADVVRGEVSVAGNPFPPEGVAVASTGELIPFTYDIRAEFGSASQAGFDSLRIDTPSWVEFDSLEVGKGDLLTTVARRDVLYREGVYRDLARGDSIYVDTSYPGRLVAYFPSEKVAPGGWDRIRLTFKTSVFVYGTRLTGRVWRSGKSLLPQSILDGNATDEVGTDQLQVLLEELAEDVLQDVKLSAQILTPNGDGVHDELRFSYKLVRLTGDAEVRIGIYDLSGALVRWVYRGTESSGVYDRIEGAYASKIWDGQDENGHLVLPGVYVARITVYTDRQVCERIKSIAVIY